MLGGTSIVSDGSGISMGTTAYLPFGGLRLSSGTIPTDKKFTGQRLDGTGLYFYNARYYDPQIGRFISADSIVPDFSNPQALNRYSYVLNNPLKYTDPSGHIVQFENEEFILGMYDEMAYWGTYYDLSEFYGEMIDGWAQLRSAWDELGGVAPDLVQELENSDKTITIGWAAMQFDAVTRKAADWDTTGNLLIQINKNFQNADKRLNAATMAHEGFHASIYINAAHSWTTNTIANEAFAFSLGGQVADKLKVGEPFAKRTPASSSLNHISPFTDSKTLNQQIVDARSILSRDAYRGLEVPWGRWPGLFGLGQGGFLTVAKSVWIK